MEVFQALGPTTENARYCIAAVWIKLDYQNSSVNRATGASTSYPSTAQADRGLLGHGSIVRGEIRYHARCTVRQEANAEPPTYNIS